MPARKINLALQGGGAHGAYTWGVLDRLLEVEELEIEGISGTSAGAMNAAMLVNGYAKGGREGARRQLETFWRRVSEAAAFSPLHQTAAERMLLGWNLDASPVYHWLDFLSRTFSPYQLNPLNLNPMRIIIEDMLDIDALNKNGGIKLFIAATHVASGQARVFHCHEVTADVLMASTCIPFLFQAVEIEGEQYWDGGYMGNPAIWPLIYHCDSEDVLLVQINPVHDEACPTTASEIINRLNEITFNSSLIAEMRAIDFVGRLLAEGKLDKNRYKAMRMHLIYSPDQMHNLNASSKLNTGWDFFRHLRALGRADAQSFLDENWKDVGRRSTLDIRGKFLSGPGHRRQYGLAERIAKTVDVMKQAHMPEAVQNPVINAMMDSESSDKKPKADKKKQVKKRK